MTGACHICGASTDLACSDCQIDLKARVWVCQNSDCRDAHERVCPMALRTALRWALIEGRKGFYTVEEGAGTFYHCRFCHAVSANPEKLNHEGTCQYFHAKKEAA